MDLTSLICRIVGLSFLLWVNEIHEFNEQNGEVSRPCQNEVTLIDSKYVHYVHKES